MAILRLDRLGPAAAALLRVLGAPPGAALVGGAVRDTVLGRAVADVDVAVPSGALDLARRCAERLGGTCVVLDAERGAARVVTDGGLTLDLTDFRAPSLEGDLAARDFTVDALAVPLAPLLAQGRAAIVDPTGGLADLKARRIRPAGAGVLHDDPLRALRGVRLDALAPYGEELAAHVAEPLGGGARRGAALKLAALLHDVSKPETRRRVEGRVRFFQHDVLGARRARAIGERLRLPERVTGVVERVVRHHLRPMHLGHAAAITPRARYRFYRDLREDTRDLLLLVLADGAAVTGASPLATWRRAGVVRELLAGWSEQREAETRPARLRGEDVMARFSLEPGPRVGWLLAQAREAQDLGRVRSREEALAFLDSLDPGP